MHDSNETNQTSTKDLLKKSNDRIRQIVKTYVSQEEMQEFVNQGTQTDRGIQEMVSALDLFTKIDGHALHEEAIEATKKMMLDCMLLDAKRGDIKDSEEGFVEFMISMVNVAAMDWFYRGYFTREIQEEEERNRV